MLGRCLTGKTDQLVLAMEVIILVVIISVVIVIVILLLIVVIIVGTVTFAIAVEKVSIVIWSFHGT